MLTTLLFLSIAGVAFTNGANANFKGVASLYGSGTTSLKVALWWGTAMTFVGSLASAFLAAELLKAFGGKGIVGEKLAATPAFVTAVAIGGALTSFLATRLGFPVSTTHAMVGGLIGAGLAGSGTVDFGGLWWTFFFPLLVSPIVAAALGVAIYWPLRWLGLAPEERTTTLDVLHFLSAGGASFARGLNDTPKIAALLLVAVGSEQIFWGIAAIGVMIAIGGLVDADRVAETLGKKITEMNPGQGFAVSLATAALVTTATIYQAPVSTTHVSVGSMVGIGSTTRQAHWPMIGEIGLAWISTVPCGALLAALAYFATSRL